MHQSLSDIAIRTSNHYPTSYAQVTIKPGMPQTTSICLNAYLQEALTLLLTDRLDSQARRVRVRPYHRDWIPWTPVLPNSKGYDSRAISGQVVFAARDAC